MLLNLHGKNHLKPATPALTFFAGWGLKMGADSDNKRIAKNSVFLYLRMLFVMCVAFYVSRIVLEALGVVDFGIYNVVGGLSTALVFFSSSLTGTTQRFLNVELGRSNEDRTCKVFNISLQLFSAIAIVVLIVGATFGRWFVAEKLNIPASQRDAAEMVLYATTISLSATFVFSVYESVLIARENMKLYAYLGIVDGLAKLGVAFIITRVPHRLETYAWLLAAVQIFPKLVMAVYCRRKYPEVRHHWVWDPKLVKEFLGFSGWYIYGSSIWMINEEGINVILNLFFGPVVNAARGVAWQVNNAVSNFANNFFMAVRPQIIKRYAAGEKESLQTLIFCSTRLSWYLFWIFILPLSLRIGYVLGLWLADVPDYAPVFVCWTLIYTMVNSLNNPIWTAMSATGNLRRSVIIGSNMFLLAFPLSYLALRLHAPAWCVYPLLCLGRLAFLFNTISNFSAYSDMTIRMYLRKVFAPILTVSAVTAILSVLLNWIIPVNFPGLIAFSVGSGAITAFVVYRFGITETERAMVLSLIKKITHRQ